jgi:hypothetical protein
VSPRPLQRVESPARDPLAGVECLLGSPLHGRSRLCLCVLRYAEAAYFRRSLRSHAAQERSVRPGGVTEAPEVERAAECAEAAPTVPERIENVSPARAVPTRSARPVCPAALTP